MSYLNQEIVREFLKISGPLCRDDLTTLLKMPRTTIYDSLKRLLEDKQVKFHDKIYGRGRPLRYWEVVK